MTPAPLPHDESERLQALRRLLIMDTPPEQRFDSIVVFAAVEFDMPIVLMSLLDENRQWFKAKVGLDACETARDISFCGHAIHQRSTLLIEDAWQDDRFADNPLVTGPPHLRFYAGAPLLMPDGSALGTLCLIDTRPRQLDPMDLAILGTLRDLNLARLREASTYEAASKMLQADCFDGVIVAVAEDGEGLSLIEMLRTGATKSPSDCPVAVLAAVCDLTRARALQGLNVRRIILTPFKVKTVLETVVDMAESPMPVAGH